ncbi:hypothetical protein [Mucilaginibacter antarcticus]|uniref:SPW repeat-containing protein n=1 Tax=Mucilaginibacter antarcticus TaxID=1855725 RepID=A0ABW5XRY8_9SPHI
MKILTPKNHGIIDYLVVLFLLASPMLFGMSHTIALFTYGLGLVHLALTLLTDFSVGVVKLIPLPIHGFIELAVGIILIALAYTLFKDDELGKLFYTGFGTAVLAVFLITDYNKSAGV